MLHLHFTGQYSAIANVALSVSIAMDLERSAARLYVDDVSDVVPDIFLGRSLGEMSPALVFDI